VTESQQELVIAAAAFVAVFGALKFFDSLYLRREQERREAAEAEFAVELFLSKVFGDVAYRFKGREWADAQQRAAVETDWSLPYASDRSKMGELEPGYARVACSECGEEKDAWVTDQGELEDHRDGWHWHGDGERYRTVVLDEDDE